MEKVYSIYFTRGKNIIRNFNSINFRKVIENYEPCVFLKLHVSKDRIAEILYKNIQLNDNLFVELFKCGRYPRQECEFTGNDTLSASPKTNLRLKL